MKKTWLFALLAMSLVTYGQKFEGTVTWSVKYELTDPAKQAEMEKNQKSLSDPANQAKMKQMQDQMNSPQMKAMMESNPQMKARMEASMKMLQGAAGGAAMPTSFIIKSKGSSTDSKMDGGATAFETLYQHDKGVTFLIDRNAKTYTIVKPDSAMHAPAQETVQSVVTKTGETMKIAGYTCTKYIVLQTGRVDTIRQVVWTTTEFKGLDMKSFPRQGLGGGRLMSFNGNIEGVPMKIETLTRQMKMTMEVTGIKKEELPAADFEIPADFTQTTMIGQLQQSPDKKN